MQTIFCWCVQLLDEVKQNIVICQWHADQLFAEAKKKFINLRDAGKSRYNFVKIKFNNCFIILSPCLFSYLNLSLAARGKRCTIFHTKAWLKLRMDWAEYHLQLNKFSWYYAVICLSHDGLSGIEKEGEKALHDNNIIIKWYFNITFVFFECS